MGTIYLYEYIIEGNGMLFCSAMSLAELHVDKNFRNTSHLHFNQSYFERDSFASVVSKATIILFTPQYVFTKIMSSPT